MRQDIKQQFRAVLSKERGTIIKKPGGRCRIALLYPNRYFVGMSNLGMHVVYGLWNKRDDVACERFFLPETEAMPLLSIETQDVLQNFAVAAFAVSYEPDYFNVVAMLRRGRVEPFAKKRTDRDPLVIVGGPCATFNAEPLAEFADAFIIGEGEEILPKFTDEFLAAKKDGADKGELLRRLATVPGVYVPSLYEHIYAADGTLSRIEPLEGAPRKVPRQWLKNLDEYPASTTVVTDKTELNMYLIEATRGCGRHCRFCMAGYCFRRPRYRSLDVLLNEAERAKGFEKKIGLMGAALSDYPYIDELCREILARGLKMSVASFRADSVTKTLVDSLVAGGLKTLTVAPEAGSDKMRRLINKGIEEEHIFRTLELGLSAGITRYRFYFMVNLPFETAEDIEEIAILAKKAAQYSPRIGRLTLSVNPFVPKPFTPFQHVPAADRKSMENALKVLRGKLKGEKKIELLCQSTKNAYLQSVLARGDRRLGAAVALAAERGGEKYFLPALKETNLSAEFYTLRKRTANEIFPWQTIDMGVTDEYLQNEARRAEDGQYTAPCTANCRRCGVCH